MLVYLRSNSDAVLNFFSKGQKKSPGFHTGHSYEMAECKNEKKPSRLRLCKAQ